MIGIPTRKTMVVPCMVKSRLKTCGETAPIFGAASCNRITEANKSGDDKEDQTRADVHQPQFFMVRRDDQVMQPKRHCGQRSGSSV